MGMAPGPASGAGHGCRPGAAGRPTYQVQMAAGIEGNTGMCWVPGALLPALTIGTGRVTRARCARYAALSCVVRGVRCEY